MRETEQVALSRDIHLLGDILGQTIKRLAGEPVFDLIEEVRSSTKELRATPSPEEARKLRDRLAALDLTAVRALIRAFSVYFDLINLAEQRARVRALYLRASRETGSALAETPEAALRKLEGRGISAAQVAEHLGHALVVPVFTAHPSEARRRTVLEKLKAIAGHLDRLEDGRLVPQERQGAIRGIAEEVEAIWLSDTIRSRRPTVLDEVRQCLETVESSLFDVVPRVYRTIEEALGKVYPGREWVVPPFLTFGSWIGGDRDGHPNVTHDVTVEAIRQQQTSLLESYLGRLDDLWRRLSHSDQSITPGQAILDANQGASEPTHEPYRARCLAISERLRATLEYAKEVRPDWGADLAKTPPEAVYLERGPLLADLRLIADDLRAAGASAAADGALRDMILLVEVFGVHLLTLDVRQNSQRHATAMDEVLKAAGVCENYQEITPDERFDLLAKELGSNRPLIPVRLGFSEDANEVILTFRTMAAALEQQSPESLHTYIISSTTEPAHLLEVLLFAREARLFRPVEGVSRIDVVPLFEASEPLGDAAAIMNRLFDLPIYRKQLALRSETQEVMIGYSDSNKECGFLQSSWALFRAQTDLAEAGRRVGVAVQMFHGRGGAVGRGGGPANRAILAQPRATVNGRLRITEQGEVIADRYGHRAIAERHLEQLVNAVLRTSLPDVADRPEPEWLAVLDRLAPSAGEHYRSLVYETPEFLEYFTQATPIGEISRLKIGSRPARRGGAVGIDQLRAIPWVFSWMQSRHTLPGWYGLGAAVADYLVDEPNGLTLLREMYQKWPFWMTLIDNAQMILAKADMTIARLYADLVEDKGLGDRLFQRIAEEYQRTLDATLKITEQEGLLERAPILQRSIQRRNPYVDPLSFLQLVILKRLRDGEEPQEDLTTAALESINGVASGLKNTG